MLIIIVIFISIIIRSDEICVNDASVNISVYNSGALHEFGESNFMEVSVIALDSGHCEDFFQDFKVNSDDFLYAVDDIV